MSVLKMLWIDLIKELFNYFLCSEERDGASSMEQTDGTWAEATADHWLWVWAVIHSKFRFFNLSLYFLIVP